MDHNCVSSSRFRRHPFSVNLDVRPTALPCYIEVSDIHNPEWHLAHTATELEERFGGIPTQLPSKNSLRSICRVMSEELGQTWLREDVENRIREWIGLATDSQSARKYIFSPALDIG